ncbi:MAG: hypothetical protein HRT87_09855 [Legionellales bacterium]|nr:hypothetical protein [Legionellales bacterium]
MNDQFPFEPDEELSANKKILLCKIEQHLCIKEKLINSGFRPIFYTYKKWKEYLNITNFYIK